MSIRGRKPPYSSPAIFPESALIWWVQTFGCCLFRRLWRRHWMREIHVRLVL